MVYESDQNQNIAEVNHADQHNYYPAGTFVET